MKVKNETKFLAISIPLCPGLIQQAAKCHTTTPSFFHPPVGWGENWEEQKEKKPHSLR